MEEYDEEEFERLCTQEMELRNELASHGNGKISSFIEVNKINISDIPCTKEHTTVKESGGPLYDNAFDDEFNEYSSCELKGHSTVKKRLLDGVTSDEESRISFKRMKSSLPIVGYEIDQSSLIDPDLEIIERILSYRKTLQTIGQPSSLITNKLSLPAADTKKKFILHGRIPKGDFQSITTESGKRFYLDVLDEKIFELSVASVGEIRDKNRLLSVPYHDLRNEAEKELLSLNSGILSGEESIESHRVCIEAEEVTGSDLWASKYKPRSYLDLLSDETTNRTVLQWMKLWDKMVFGHNLKSRKKEKVVKGKAKFLTKFAPEVLEEFDEIGRPQQKVVLLCGPPGLGKTTLAHIIATHAGYNAVEMNASDDRNVESFRTNLENATSMKSVFGTDKRPNCLIIDEIDGAPAASINLLVSLLQAKKLKGEISGKKKGKLVLRRPVICICNDLYTPSLRPLRQISLVIQFPPTQSLKLAQRLHFISQKQQMKADFSVLLALCNKTENDIRSCLSVLQFVRITSGELKLTDLEGISVGQKDYQRSLFTVWHNIFTLPRPKREPWTNPHIKHTDPKTLLEEIAPEKPSHPIISQMSRFNHILKVAQSCGEYERLTLGFFENYPHLKFKHTHLEPVTAALDWTTTADLLEKEMAHNQNWSLGPYVPLSFVAYHFLFASNTRPKLQFPNRYQEFSSKLVKAKSLIDLMIEGMSAYTRLFSSKISLVQDVIPYVMSILQPSLRPVNVQLFSSKEKDELKRLVNTMISYNLTYQQERTAEGTYVFTLDPNIEGIAHFPTLPKLRVIPYSSKQLIARETELEKVRRAERYFSSQFENSSVKTPTLKAIDTKSEKAKESQTTNSSSRENKSMSSHLQMLQAKKINKTQLSNVVVVKDFFGRVITPSDKQQQSSQNDLLKSDVWFKFKNGYSNAVRRHIRMKEFFS